MCIRDRNVTTTGVQTYNDPVTLNGTYTTTNALFTAAGTTTLAGATTVSTGTGGATFTGAVDGGNTLAVNTSGTTTFSAAVGGTTPLTSLTTDAGGTTTLKNVTTTGVQTYNDPVTLNGTYTTTDSFFSDGAPSTGADTGGIVGSVKSGYATAFSAAVGGTTALTSLTTDA